MKPWHQLFCLFLMAVFLLDVLRIIIRDGKHEALRRKSFKRLQSDIRASKNSPPLPRACQTTNGVPSRSLPGNRFRLW
jgi:hypothetical protein